MLDLCWIIGQPLRRTCRMIPNERMTFGNNSIGTRPFEHLVSIGEIRLAAPGFISGPIKCQSAVVQKSGETLAVHFFLFRVGTMPEIEEIAAKEKVVAELLDSNRHAWDWSTP